MGDSKVIFTPVDIPLEELATHRFFDDREISDGGMEARLLYPILGKCERCDSKAEHRHHKDRNRNNNARENIEFLCIPCHGREHSNNPHNAD